MARTKASVGSKVSAGKSSKARCSVAPIPSTSGTSGSSDRGARSTGGGNSVCQRETPKWQKPITNFFINKDGDKKGDVDVESDIDEQEAGTSNQNSNKNVIESDDEEVLIEKPKNTVLDESIELETLNGEASHKIEEYYGKGNKGKGIGKKSSNSNGKENRRQSKRLRDNEEESVSKKVRVD